MKTLPAMDLANFTENRYYYNRKEWSTADSH